MSGQLKGPLNLSLVEGLISVQHVEKLWALLDNQASPIAAGQNVGPVNEAGWFVSRGDLKYLVLQGVRVASDATYPTASAYEALCAADEKKRERILYLEGLLNTPEIEDFDKAVPLESAHQVDRWGAAHDDGKNPEDWFWLVGYLTGKALAALKAGDLDKAKHHCISTAAALRNWHAHIRQGWTFMRPGIASPDKASGQVPDNSAIHAAELAPAASTGGQP